jgi:hypothetical protein
LLYSRQEVAEGLDMQPHLIEIDSAMKRYQPTFGKPLIVASQLRPPRLETVWGDILQGR